MTTFSDIFKKSFLNGYAADEITLTSICMCMIITTVLGLYIYLAHRILTRKCFYEKNFGISLVAMSLITAGIVLAIQSSVVISLGMVGALSIVRFRNAVKNPVDLVYLFWAISVGIICGAGIAQIAVVLSLTVTIVLVVLDLIPVAKAPMLLVVNAEQCGAARKIMEVVSKYSQYSKVKSRNMSRDQLDMVIEVRIKDDNACLEEIMDLEGVKAAALLSHDGEVSF